MPTLPEIEVPDPGLSWPSPRHLCPWLKCYKTPSRSLDFVDGALGGHEVGGARRRHVEGLGFPVEAGTLAGYAQAALAGRDDFCDELLAVHADLHGDPVLGHFLGQLQLVLWSSIPAAVFGQPADRKRERIRTKPLMGG